MGSVKKDAIFEYSKYGDERFSKIDEYRHRIDNSITIFQVSFHMFWILYRFT